ncbi:MAG: hypothetical protein QXV81_08840 [Ignisphaera sp.]
MRREQTRFSYHGYKTDVNMIDFYIGADVETIPCFNAKHVDTVPRPKISKLVNPYTLLLSNNLYARILVAYRFPAHLPEDFLYSIFSDVSEIALIYRTIERSKAVSMVGIAIDILLEMFKEVLKLMETAVNVKYLLQVIL